MDFVGCLTWDFGLCPEAWELEQTQWVADRAGVAKARAASWLRESFETAYVNTATGRWEMERFKQALSKMAGRREAIAGRRDAVAARAPMQEG